MLVTGCAGFIGWKTCSLLLKNGEEVAGIDNLNTYYDPKIKDWRLSELKKFPNFPFNKMDITEIEPLRQIFKDRNPEAVINLAARAGVRASVENPWDYVDTNITGTLNLLELCREFDVKKFVLASTSSLYGTNKMPFCESDRTDNLLSPYAATKKAAEAMCYTYHFLYGIDITIPRYFTVYGPAGRPDMSIFKFIKNIYEGKTIEVFGDGKQKRDFTYVDDIAAGTVKALKPLGYEIINLGNNNPVELMYVINLIEENLGKKAKMRFLPKHPADVSATCADIEKAKRLLGWEPEVRIEEGIKRTIDWYSENESWLKNMKI
ncbi:MAG: NAD-dependent epimerase/dehydratase family protein [Candidatus Methanoperedens sp.]